MGLFPNALAQNENLLISAESSQFNNTFAGPMVIEVKISDNDISYTNMTLSRPSVFVANKTLEMVQGQDGNWYGYFADKTMAQIADSTTTLDGIGLDFGGICDVADARKNILRNDDSNFFKNASAIAYSDPSCDNNFDDNNINVLRKAKKVNNNLDNNVGQANLYSSDVWPFIQLYDFNPEDKILIEYQKNDNIQNVTLSFENPNSNLINLELEGKTSYVANSPVFLSLGDIQLNIDPTDNDSWTWKTKDPGGLFYQFFDKFGESEMDGTSGAVDVAPFLTDLMFTNNGRLLLNPHDGDYPPVVNLRNNTFQTIFGSGDISSVRSEKNSLPEGSQPITLRESGVNTAVFHNYDGDRNSNLAVTDDAKKDTVAWIEYDKTWHGILVRDYSIAWDKPEYFGNDTATITINNQIMNENTKSKDAIETKIYSRSNPDGIRLKLLETGPDSGIFKGSIILYNQKNNLCGFNDDENSNRLCVYDEDKVYASYSYPGIDDLITSSKAKSTVSSFHNETQNLVLDILNINFTKSSDYYFTAIEQLEQRLENNNFASNKYNITTTVNETDDELVISQTITIYIANRTEYDLIFNHNKFKNFTSIDESTIKEKIKVTLDECNENNNSINCNEKINSVLFNIDNQIGIHKFTESIFYNRLHHQSNSSKIPYSLVNETKSKSGEEEKKSLIDWPSSFPFFEFLNIDLMREMIPNAQGEALDDKKTVHQEFQFINGFSYGFGFGKSFAYEYTPDGFDDFFSTEARFAFGLGLGLRIPVNVTVTDVVAKDNEITDSQKKISFTAQTLDLNEAEYEELGIPSYQAFEGHEFAAYLGPELHASAGLFEKGPFYEYEKELPKPSSEHFVPPLGEDPVEFTNFDYSISDFVPFLDFAKFFFTVDAYAGVNGYLEGDKITMSISSPNNSTLYQVDFKKNNETQTLSYPSNIPLMIIGNLTYNSSLNFKPKIGGEAYFMGITILSEEIELADLILRDIPLGPHPGTISSYDLDLNENSVNYFKGIMDVEGYQVHYTINTESRPEGRLDKSANSLIIKIDPLEDGQLTINLPRKLIDAKIGTEDKDFLVLVDDEEINFEENKATSTDRTLNISFSSGAEEIRIIGTTVIPEFGIMPILILATAIACITFLKSTNRIRIVV